MESNLREAYAAEKGREAAEREADKKQRRGGSSGDSGQRTTLADMQSQRPSRPDWAKNYSGDAGAT